MFLIKEKWLKGKEVVEGKKKEVCKEVEEILVFVKEKVCEEKKFVGEMMKLVYKVIEMVKIGLDFENGKIWFYVILFLILIVVVWIVGLQILIVFYEWIYFGIFMIDWGILNGFGWWFRDIVGMVYEIGQMGFFIWVVIMGFVLMVIMFVRNLVVGYFVQGIYWG